jgi:hypothetical protein
MAANILGAAFFVVFGALALERIRISLGVS